jgi:hypothetical protein
MQIVQILPARLEPEWVELREVPDALDLSDECLDVVRLYV